jgi:hypothetical protein
VPGRTNRRGGPRSLARPCITPWPTGPRGAAPGGKRRVAASRGRARARDAPRRSARRRSGRIGDQAISRRRGGIPGTLVTAPTDRRPRTTRRGPARPRRPITQSTGSGDGRARGARPRPLRDATRCRRVPGPPPRLPAIVAPPAGTRGRWGHERRIISAVIRSSADGRPQDVAGQRGGHAATQTRKALRVEEGQSPRGRPPTARARGGASDWSAPVRFFGQLRRSDGPGASRWHRRPRWTDGAADRCAAGPPLAAILCGR